MQTFRKQGFLYVVSQHLKEHQNGALVYKLMIHSGLDLQALGKPPPASSEHSAPAAEGAPPPTEPRDVRPRLHLLLGVSRGPWRLSFSCFFLLG